MKIARLPILGAVLATLFPAGPVFASSERLEPLLDRALNPPNVSYSGRKLVVTWYGTRSRAAENRVFFKPPAKWRHELLDAGGKVQRTVIQNGSKEWILSAGTDVILVRDLRDIRKGRMAADRLRELLLVNHDLKTAGKKSMLGRTAEGIVLKPKSRGGPRRKLWVEPESGIILARRQTNDSGLVVRDSRLTSLNVGEELEDSLFAPPPDDPRPIVAAAERPSVESRVEFVNQGFPRAPWVKELPFGYALDSTRVLTIARTKIGHMRYTNGLTMLSLFISPKKIDSSSAAEVETDEEDNDFTALAWAGRVLGWDRDGQHYLLVGDLTGENLKWIQRKLFPPEGR